MTKIYHNPRCSKSRAALAYLQEQGLEPEVIEYLKTPLSVEQLNALVAQCDLSVRELVRTNEAPYTDLQLDQADEQQLLEAIAEHPILLNRPLVQTKKGVRLGRPLEAIYDIL
ncbi:arsenate reductase (glutaredoxin) [Paenalcaligenes hermetiae]|uniref:Arsenate reductase n=1 Tax=Paenalcaligenes hermetiae TaxID=1157987 RepID=A0ABP9MD76_9BURK